MEWISVKDRLPEKNEYVLIGWIDDLYNKYPESMDCSLAFGQIHSVPTLPDTKIWATIKFGGQDNHSIMLQIDSPPTHWMPLPEPPKEKP